MLIKIDTGEYPITESAFRSRFPNTSFGENFTDYAAFGYAVVQPSTKPSYDTLIQTPREDTPTLTEGVYSESWSIQPKLAAQVDVSLAQAKSAKNDYINSQRWLANQTTFTHGGKSFQCDALSRGDIDWVNGYVATHEALPPGFPGAWKATDNTYYSLPDVAAWNAFYLSIGVVGAANFAHAQSLKAQLALVTDPATAQAHLDAIVW
jgi:hypothetical protein